MSKLRWGVIGCARIAINSVIPAIQESSTGIVTAIASRGEEKAKAVAARLGIAKAYGSYEALLTDPEIDAVYIPLPNHLHAEWAIRAAQAGKHVLCEKPIALNTVEAARIVEACKLANLHLAEAFMYRHHPRYKEIRKLIGEGAIGEIRSIRAAFTFRNPDDLQNVRFRTDWGGGSVYDVGCYPISAGRMIVGAEPEAVTCHGFFSKAHDHVDMMLAGLIEFPNGVPMIFDCGMWAAFRNELEILGSDGRIVVPAPFINQPGHFYVTDKEDRTREHYVGQFNHYMLQADHFAQVVRGNAEPYFAPGDVIGNMKVVEACLESAKRRERVVL